MQLGFYNDFENVPEQRSRTPAVQSTSFGLRNRPNQDVKTNSHVNASTRTFGMQSKISTFNGNMNLNQDVVEMNRNDTSLVSRTFGLISDDIGPGSQKHERLPQELRQNEYSVNKTLMSRPFGLQMRNLTSFSHVEAENNLRANERSEFMNYRRNNINISSVSRTFGMTSENLSSLNLHNNERLNHDLRSNNYVNSSLMLRSGGLQPRNFTVNSVLNSAVGSCSVNQDSLNRNNSISTSRIFQPTARSSTLSMGLQRQESESYNDIISGDGFKRPSVSRVIRGRNSTLSSRLFHSESTERPYKDLSNINGFSVSHISQRNGDTFSRSRLAVNMRSNCIDNQSICQSVLSGASVKAQVMNLLENLHYSILNIGPHVTAEAVRMEFDKAKQSLENISEMSFAPSTWNGDAASVISQSSRTNYPTTGQATTSDTLDGGLLHLKSSKELLESLISKESVNKSKMKNNYSRNKGGKNIVIRSSRNKDSDEEENSELVFKKPRAYPKRKKTSRVTKLESPRRGKNSESKAERKITNLRQWYPISVGSDLSFCGVDEQGETVRTVAVKKRVNNRKVELINGVVLHLIGSPSTMVSILPQKIMSFLKNGLTDRWRILQKELLNCQTAEEDIKKRKSRSPKVTSSPKKKKKQRKTPEAKIYKREAQTSKIKNTPMKEVAEMRTRSGRAIKPPGMYWLVPDTGSDEVTSTSTRATPEAAASHTSPNKTSGKTIEETPVKRLKNISRKSPNKRAKVKRNISSGDRKKSPKKVGRKPSEAKEEEKEQAKVDSSTEQEKRQNKGRQSCSKRKREIAGDAEAVQPKKSKLENKTETEITQSSIKKKKTGPSPSKLSPKSRERKLTPAKKKKEPPKKKTTKNLSESKKEIAETKETKETREIMECEEDFEFKLDDIEIPEIGNVSGNPQLSRSQLRSVSMETPPLRYFSNNLKILSSATPVRSPDWCISQRTESEVKQFQRRREEAFKKKIKVDVKKTVITEKSKSVESRDMKRVMEWVAEKTVRTPQWSSKVLQYIIPSRKRMEEQANEEDDDDI